MTALSLCCIKALKSGRDCDDKTNWKTHCAKQAQDKKTEAAQAEAWRRRMSEEGRVKQRRADERASERFRGRADFLIGVDSVM